MLKGVISIDWHGRGLVSTPQGEFSVARRRLCGAMDGDRVSIAVLPRSRREQGHDGRARAMVTDVLSRARDEVAGRIERVGLPRHSASLWVVVPYDRRVTFDVFVDSKGLGSRSVRDGDVVRVRLTTYPSAHESALGHVVEVLGHEGDAGLDTLLLMQARGLERGFPPAAEAEAAVLAPDASAAAAQTGRHDLRDLLTATIDPASARDFDDALSCECEGDGWHLWVHIADVSACVVWDGPIDREARRRGTSTYLADAVVPMLPERLGNDLCSLAPHADRLAMTVEAHVAADGGVTGFVAYPSVVRSDARLDYDSVQRRFDGLAGWNSLVEGDVGPAKDGAAALREMLTALDDFAQTLRRSRLAHGGVELASCEPELELDSAGHVTNVRIRRTTRATSLVEEAMVLANELVAGFLFDKGLPCIYRVHGEPKADRLASLAAELAQLGYETDGLALGDAHALQRVLDEAADRPEGPLVSLMVLRSMQRACYQVQPAGHYGLGLAHYCHFTSPIRRYPDLMVHRLLKAALGCGGLTPAQLGEATSALDRIAEQCSRTERDAEETERQSVEDKLFAYLANQVGQTFDALVTDLVRTGAFVELDCTAEGLVRAEPGRLAVGQRVRVRLAEADRGRRKLAFELADEGA